MGLKLNVNGREVLIAETMGRSLLGVLRDHLDLTGSKYGCGEGQCGACTVLVDGYPTRSCITTPEEVAGRRITTIEGLEENGRLHPIQQAFLDEEALQCAFCTSGMIMSAHALLIRHPEPTTAQIARSMQGNICRCGTYGRITAAIRRAATALRERGHG